MVPLTDNKLRIFTVSVVDSSKRGPWGCARSLGSTTTLGSKTLSINGRNIASGLSRRSALRGAAWTTAAVTVVVATPNIAAATPGATCSSITGDRTGANFDATISCTGGTIQSVTIGSAVANNQGAGVYRATITGNVPNQQLVIVTFVGGATYRQAVNFV